MLPLISEPLAYHRRDNPSAVADWIKARIPCPVGGYASTSPETQNRIFEALMRQGVPSAVALEAMNDVFGDRIRVKRPSMRPQPAFRRPSAASDDYAATMSWYEYKFVFAQMNNDSETMNQIIEAIVRLLYHAAGGQGEQFERVRRAVRANARSVGAVVLHLTRDELRRFRTAPTPNDFPRLRINPQRNVQRHRARRRAR